MYFIFTKLPEKNYDEQTLAQQSEIEKEVCTKMIKYWVPTLLLYDQIFFFLEFIVNECFVWLGIILIFNPSFYFKWHQLTYLLTNEWLMFPLFYVTQFNFFFLYFKYTLIIYCLTEIDVLTYCRQKTIQCWNKGNYG